MSTNQQNNDNNATTLIRAVFFVAVLAVTAGIVIFLKSTGDTPLTPEGLAARDSIRHIAKPDTTPIPAVGTGTDDAYTSDTDSLMNDSRLPADAGYEDGYFAGITDGITDNERASYDESSLYPSATDRRTYADAYRRGYAQGYKDGVEGKRAGTFQIFDDEELTSPDPSEGGGE